MDRVHELEVFVAVADAGSFAKAAGRLRLSPPAVTRAISALEERLGARVFHRTTRSLTITEVGQHFLASARRILTDLDVAEREAVGAAAAPQGHLTITAPVTFGRAELAPVVCDFLRQHPRVTASLLLVDRVVNLVEEGVDVAVRIGPLPDSNLIAKRVGSVQRWLVASPTYLKRRGTPTSPAELKGHAIIAFSGLTPTREWRFGVAPHMAGVTLSPTLEVNDALTAIEAAERGHGITVALSYMVRERVAAGRLVPVLADLATAPRPVHLLYPQVRVVARKVRAFVDFAAPHLSEVH